MVSRIVGALLLVVGLFMAGAGIYALSVTHSIAAQLSVGGPAQGIAFDAIAWSTRWQLWSTTFLSIGVAVFIAGLALVRRRAWGLLLLATASGYAALFPWVLVRLGSVQYGFEVPSVRESIIIGSAALLSLLAFIRLRGSIGT